MTGLLRFVVLIPHRDSGKALAEYRRELFAAGLVGAYSFPAVAPLAVVSHAFTLEALKELGRSLRELSLQEGRGGKISVQGLGCVPAGPAGLCILGPRLDLPSPVLSQPGVLYRFPRLVLAGSLLPDKARQGPLPERLPPSPEWFFRAAMVANLLFRPLGSGSLGYSFEWRMAPPLWLPRQRV
ncbi:MAG: hypothetical protein LBD74_01535 [Spirochaetaceae bacterium]|jgi:hypothetical protein|nr:hypothetical protein [Spirochaetaceae bacterium]